MVTCRGKPSGNVFVNTNVAAWGRLGIAKNLVHRAKMEEKDFIDKKGVYDVVPRSDAWEKGCRVIRTRWVTVNKGPMTLLSYVPGGLPRSSVDVAVTNTSTSQGHLT